MQKYKMILRLMTYNIHQGVGTDRRHDVGRIVSIIGHYAPDIVLLQEVLTHDTGSFPFKQCDIIGNWLDYRHRAYFPQVIHRKNGRWGNAILSRHPIADSDHIDLTIPLKKKRSVLHARIRVRTHRRQTRTVNIYNMHLGLSGIERRIQLRRFLKSLPFAHLHARAPIVVAGDLNDFWGILGRKILSPAGFNGPQTPLRTFPSYAPIRALDGIYVRGDVQISSLHRAHLELCRRASDHLPLIADLSLS